MNVNLKSKELLIFFQNNGILTPSIAQKVANNITINLQGPVTPELLEDIRNISYEFPKLLRHITIKNDTSKPIDMSELVRTIGNERRTNKEFNKFLSFKIESRHREDFGLDYGDLHHVDGIALINTDPQALGSLNLATYRLPGGTKELELEGFDLSTVDLNYAASVRDLTLTGNRNQGFARMRGRERLNALGFAKRPYDEEVREGIRFANTAPKLHTFGTSGVNLSGVDILREVTNPNLASLYFMDANLTSLEGLESWNGRLDNLNLSGNMYNIADLERMNAFRRENNETYVSFKRNSPIVTHFNSLSTEEFSGRTSIVINETLTKEIPTVTRPQVLSHLMANKYTPYSIHDAERVRRDAKITLNPMVLERDSDLDTFDFSKDYLRDGTLVLTVSQIDRLLASGKTIPMNISIGIKDAAELSSEKLRDICSRMKIQDVRMMGQDLSDNQRDPYTPVQYARSRELLDEVVSGIDKNETDIDKFTTIYTRLAYSMGYDYTAIKSDTTDEKRHTRDVVNTSRNLIGGLTTGQCVCAGYAETLRNALALVGIRARYVRGKCFDDPDYSSRHAWSHVELEGPDGTKKWYLADLTWDNRASKNPNDPISFDYMLIDEPTFRKNHQVTYTKYMQPSSLEPYDRNAARRSLEKARTRMLNPRVSWRNKEEARKAAKQKEDERRRQEEERKRQEEEKKRQEELKKKSEEERKRLEEERKKAEEKRKAELEKVTFEGLDKLRNNRDNIKNELDKIYATLRAARDLPVEKQKEYRDKAKEIEKQIQKMNEDIDTYKDMLYSKESKILNDDKAKLEELKAKKKEQEDAAKTKKEMPKPKPVVAVNKEFLDAAKEARIAALQSLIANREAVLIGYGDKAHPNREQELAEWKRELADLQSGKVYDSIVENAKQNEMKDLKERIANREAMLVARDMPQHKWDELANWKERLGLLEGGVSNEEPVEPKPEPGVDPELDKQIKELEESIKAREERLRTISSREVTTFEEFEIEDEEKIAQTIKKSVKEERNEIKQREKETRAYSTTHLSSANLIQTKKDLFDNERAIRARHAEDRLIRFTNSVFNRNDEDAPDWVKDMIEFGVGITMRVRNTVDKWITGEDKYDAELASIKNANAVVKKETPRFEGKATSYVVKQEVQEKKRAPKKPNIEFKRENPEEEHEDR